MFTKPLNWFLPGVPNSTRRSLFKIHFNIILPEKPKSSEISYPFKFPDQHSTLIYYVSKAYTFHRFHSLLFDSNRLHAEDEF